MKKPPKPRKRLSAEDRYLAKLYGRRKTHERPIHTIFLRLNSRHRTCNASHFRAAGYPWAELPAGADWREVHRWCSEQFRDRRGRTYTWTGHFFWFLTEADRDKFVAKFVPHDGL